MVRPSIRGGVPVFRRPLSNPSRCNAPVRPVEARSPIHPIFDNAGDHTYWGSAQPAYTATSVARPPSPEQLELADLSLTGNYAIQPVWADSHSSGFYSFEHLRRNCRCEEDTARRLAEELAPEGLPEHAHD